MTAVPVSGAGGVPHSLVFVERMLFLNRVGISSLLVCGFSQGVMETKGFSWLFWLYFMGTIFPEIVLNSAAHRNPRKWYSTLWRVKQREFRQQWVLQLCRITADLFSPSLIRGILQWLFQVEHGLRVEQEVGFVEAPLLCVETLSFCLYLAVCGCSINKCANSVATFSSSLEGTGSGSYKIEPICWSCLRVVLLLSLEVSIICRN